MPQQMCCLEKKFTPGKQYAQTLFTRAIHIGLKTSLVEFLGESVVLYLVLGVNHSTLLETVGGMKKAVPYFLKSI